MMNRFYRARYSLLLVLAMGVAVVLTKNIHTFESLQVTVQAVLIVSIMLVAFFLVWKPRNQKKG